MKEVAKLSDEFEEFREEEKKVVRHEMDGESELAMRDRRRK